MKRSLADLVVLIRDLAVIGGIVVIASVLYRCAA